MPRSYSGNCFCSVVIDRYKDSATEILYTESEAEDIDLDEKFQLEEIELFIEGNAYYEPGRLWGDPEECYPEESEVEIESITDKSGNDWKHKLTNSEIEMVKDTIVDYIKDPY